MKLQSCAWYCPEEMCVKVRVLYRDDVNIIHGVILKIPEEKLYAVAPGCKIPQSFPEDIKPYDPEDPMDKKDSCRWTALVKEINE